MEYMALPSFHLCLVTLEMTCNDLFMMLVIVVVIDSAVNNGRRLPPITSNNSVCLSPAQHTFQDHWNQRPNQGNITLLDSTQGRGSQCDSPLRGLSLDEFFQLLTSRLY